MGKYTLKEYKEICREWEDLSALDTQLLYMSNEITSSESRPYRDALSTLRNRLQHINSSYGWQGADADSFREQALEIYNELKRAADDYATAVQAARTRVNTRNNELAEMFADCSELVTTVAELEEIATTVVQTSIVPER